MEENLSMHMQVNSTSVNLTSKPTNVRGRWILIPLRGLLEILAGVVDMYIALRVRHAVMR